MTLGEPCECPKTHLPLLVWVVSATRKLFTGIIIPIHD